MLSTTLLIASLCTLILGAPTAYNLNFHASRTDIPAGLSPTVVAPPASPLQLRIAFAQNSFAALEERLHDVSTPSRTTYGKHLSKKEVGQLLNSSSDSYSKDSVLFWVDVADAAKDYANAAGVAVLNSWIAASASVNEENEIPDANISVFKRDESGLHAIRILSYSIPVELEGHCALIVDGKMVRAVVDAGGAGAAFAVLNGRGGKTSAWVLEPYSAAFTDVTPGSNRSCGD